MIIQVTSNEALKFTISGNILQFYNKIEERRVGHNLQAKSILIKYLPGPGAHDIGKCTRTYSSNSIFPRISETQQRNNDLILGLHINTVISNNKNVQGKLKHI